MIHVYDIGNEEYEKNGNVILEPEKGSVRGSQIQCSVRGRYN